MIDFLKGKVTPKDWLAVAVILGVAAALVIAFYLVVHKQQTDELLAVIGQRDQMFKQLQDAQKIASEIDDLKVEVDKIQILVNDFEERLPSTSELRQLINKFEDLAEESELRVELDPAARLVDQKKETWPYKVTAYGGFHQISSFINRLERYERYLKISDLVIKEEEQGISEATFTLSTYVFREDAATAAPPATSPAGA